MKTILMLTAGILVCGLAAAQPAAVRKQGGVGFRYDDNRTPKMWNEMAAVFNKYGFPLMYAVNTKDGKALSPAQQDCLRELVRQGHEIMDHTLNHRVFAFYAPDTAKYANEPWVDHVGGGHVRVKYIYRDDAPDRYAPRKLKVDFDGGRVVIPEKYQKLFNGSHLLKYQGKAYVVRADRKQKGVFEIKSFWGEPVDMGSVKGADVEALSKNYGFSVPPEALKAMAEITAGHFKAMGLPLPKTWIQPGSFEAIIQADNVRAGLADAGYICAATYQDSAFKVFCESEPERCAFAMMWGQLHLEHPGETVEGLKTKVADGYARHQVLFASSHMTVRQLPGGWKEFLRRHDELLAWCKKEGIPVRTQSQWAKLLYYSKTDPAQNVFPPWTADRDGNGRPDGYRKMGAGVTVNAKGELVAPQKGEVFSIYMLGGVEKGKNTLRFQVRSGTPLCRVTYFKRHKMLDSVQFTGSEKTFDMPAEADYVSIQLWNNGDTPLVLSGASLNQ